MSRLIVMSKTAAVKQINLRDGIAASIGRGDHCDIVVPLAHVSRAHAEIVAKGDVAVVRDLGSSNGTYVNGRRVMQHELRHGDVVSVGGHEIRFLATESVSQPVELLALAD